MNSKINRYEWIRNKKDDNQQGKRLAIIGHYNPRIPFPIIKKSIKCIQTKNQLIIWLKSSFFNLILTGMTNDTDKWRWQKGTILKIRIRNSMRGWVNGGGIIWHGIHIAIVARLNISHLYFSNSLPIIKYPSHFYRHDINSHLHSILQICPQHLSL